VRCTRLHRFQAAAVFLSTFLPKEAAQRNREAISPSHGAQLEWTTSVSEQLPKLVIWFDSRRPPHRPSPGRRLMLVRLMSRNWGQATKQAVAVAADMITPVLAVAPTTVMDCCGRPTIAFPVT
jgi:hypothetical protein